MILDEQYFRKGKWALIASDYDIRSSKSLATFIKQPDLLEEIASFLNEALDERGRMLDLGCGYGFLSSILGSLLGFRELHGVDLNEERIAIAETRLNSVLKLDLETDSLPFPNEHFDLIVSFGVLEHLRFFDNPLKEAYRTLNNKGLLLISIPNLADWVNRVRLLLGLQPHSVEISCNPTNDHIHTCTLRTLEKLLIQYGFMPLKAYGAKAIYRSNSILKFLDNLFSRKASLSIRFFSVAQK